MWYIIPRARLPVKGEVELFSGVVQGLDGFRVGEIFPLHDDTEQSVGQGRTTETVLTEEGVIVYKVPKDDGDVLR